MSFQAARMMILSGLVILNISCNKAHELTVYQCEAVETVRVDGSEPASIDPFVDSGAEVSDQFEDTQESWTITQVVQIPAGPELERLLDYRSIPLGEQSRSVPMSPYVGAVGISSDSGERLVLAAIKADKETIRLSDCRLSRNSNILVGRNEFDNMCFIADKTLAAKLILIIKRQNKAEMATPLNASDSF